MLTLTDTASEAIRAILAGSSAPDGGMRIATNGSSNGAQGLSMAIVAQPQIGDARLWDEDVPVFLEAEAVEALDGTVLDAMVDEGAGQVQFVLVPAAP